MANAIDRLVDYAVREGLCPECERLYRTNLLYGVFCPDGGVPEVGDCEAESLQALLDGLCDEAVRLGRIADTQASRDRFDTALMGALTPAPGVVIADFERRYQKSPEAATDAFYALCRKNNYIRTERVARDLRWDAPSRYGTLEISINRSKPEKDPRDIAAAGKAAASGYPACALCAQNEGYAGSLTQPARQNLRIIPLRLAGDEWGLQYSPYVYYDEHCIVLNRRHQPMRIDDAVFDKLLDFVRLFPHYFVGSNADLPIVGGSILSHEHFQGGRHELPMARARLAREIFFAEFPSVSAHTLFWPMSVVRLTSENRTELVALAQRILSLWRGYSDESAQILAASGNEIHNTITPIARRRGAAWELDLVLRNNRTSPEFPAGIFHPHEPLHHIKKENIGLIEVMGLAVLPARLVSEMAALREVFLARGDYAARPETALHADWMREVESRHPEMTGENCEAILREEIGRVFALVLEDAGVFKQTEVGQAAFARFLESAGGKEK